VGLKFKTCGLVIQEGEIRFFKFEDTLFIGAEGINPLFGKPGGWQIENLNTGAGILPSTTQEPKWWTDGKETEGPAYRRASYWWNCCWDNPNDIFTCKEDTDVSASEGKPKK